MVYRKLVVAASEANGPGGIDLKNLPNSSDLAPCVL